MNKSERVGTTDDGTHTPVYFDGRYFWYGCSMVPEEGEAEDNE